MGSCHWLGFVLNWIGVINVVPKSGLVGCLESGLGSCLATHKILYSPFSGKLTRSHKIFVPGSFLGRPTPSVYNLQRSCKGIHRISGQGLYVKVAITSHFQELTRSLALSVTSKNLCNCTRILVRETRNIYLQEPFKRTHGCTRTSRNSWDRCARVL